MFSWDEFVSKPFIYFEKIVIDDKNIDLNRYSYEDWRSMQNLNIQDLLNTDEVNWEKIQLNISVMIESDFSDSNEEYRNRIELLQSNHVKASVKVYSRESKKYISYNLDQKEELEEFLDSPNSFVVWKGEFEISNLVFSGDLIFEPSLISKLPEMGNSFLNIGGGEGFKQKDGIIMKFKENIILKGSSPRIIPTSFETSEEYKQFIPSKYKNSAYVMHLDSSKFGEPVLFVNIDIEQNKKLHADYSKNTFSTFYDLWKFTYHNHYLYAWTEIINYAIKQAITKDEFDIEDYYKNLLKKLSIVFVSNSKEKGSYGANQEFISNLKLDASHYDIHNWLIKELDLKKTVQGVVDKHSKLGFKTVSEGEND